MYLETEVLWAHFLGRLKREIDRKTHSLIHLTRVGSEREAGRSVAAKSVRLGERVVASFGESHSRRRSVPSSFVYTELLELLMIGGYAFVGNFPSNTSGDIFAPLEDCRAYLKFVKTKACPLDW